MLLSIIIVSHNTKKLLKQCIESIIKSKRNSVASFSETKKYARSRSRNNWEIIVVDNHSTDGTREWLKKLQNSKTPNKFQIIFNKENVGFAKANNQGIKITKGKYVMFLNPGIRLLPGTIKQLIVASKKKDAGIVAPKLLEKKSKKSQASCFRRQSAVNAFQKYIPRGGFSTVVDAVVSTVMLVPKSVIDVVGLFDERYSLYYKDLDYCRRVKKAGFSVYYVPQAKVVYQAGGKIKNKQELVIESKKFYGFLKYYLIRLSGGLNNFRPRRFSFVKIAVIIMLATAVTCLLFWWVLPNVL